MTTAATEAAIRESFGRVVYTHKTHEKCADLLQTTIQRVKVLQVVMATLTTGGIVGALLSGSRCLGVVSAIVSAASFALSLYQLQFTPAETLLRHRKTASKLWIVREKYLSLLSDIRDGVVAGEAVRERRDKLIDELNGIYSEAPITNSTAYKRAQSALKVEEDMTFSDAEIDQFLPTALRSSGEAEKPDAS